MSSEIVPKDAPTKKDWLEIHQEALGDKDFRYQLETDPTAAIKAWASRQVPPIAFSRLLPVISDASDTNFQVNTRGDSGIRTSQLGDDGFDDEVVLSCC